jgi:putative ABC transport system substrate-binding protein
MKRREFITLLGGAAAWPVAARAQQPKLPTIGYLGVSTASSWRDWTAAFVRRLGELGWTEGRTVAIEYRWGQTFTEGWRLTYAIIEQNIRARKSWEENRKNH